MHTPITAEGGDTIRTVAVRESFYLPTKESEPGGSIFMGWYDSTEHTVGPWAADQQHAGPPTALGLRAVGHLGPQPTDALPARLTAEIFSPIPVAALWVRSRLVRPGRRVAWAVAEIGPADSPDRTVMRIAVWLLRRTEPVALPVTPPRPAPRPGHVRPAPAGWPGGYLRAITWRLADGSFTRPGPATAWTELNVDLVQGEEPTGAQRTAIVADAGSGISAVADPSEVVFVNTELTMHLYREPVGPSIWMDAHTTVDPRGVGYAHTRLGDADGEVGAAAQALFVHPR